MPTVDNYAAATQLFAKARDPKKGKPLAVLHWRLYKDGDEFVFNHYDVQVARMLPDDRLIVTGYGSNNPPSVVVATADKVLPIRIIRRTQSHYRVHIETGRGGGAFTKYGVEDWLGMLTGGSRLYNDVVFDLATRTAVAGGAEPIIHTDKDANKKWLAQLRQMKQSIKVLIRLGAMDARLAQISASGQVWGDCASLLRASDEHLAIMAADLRAGVVSEQLADLLAQSCARSYYGGGPTQAEQSEHIDKIFSRNSAALRMALGVITVA